MFHIRVANIEERHRLIDYLRGCNIQAIFHYIPLHSSVAGMKYGQFVGDDRYTTLESERLVRLPMYYGLAEKDIFHICENIKSFYEVNLDYDGTKVEEFTRVE